MSDWTDQILDAIQRVSILDYRKDEATGRPSKVGEQTAAMIFNAVRAAEGRAIDPAEDWQTSNNDDWSIPYALSMGETLDGRPSVHLTSTAALGEAVVLDTPEQIDELIARLRRARATLAAG
jgi:hypothetical protein